MDKQNDGSFLVEIRGVETYASPTVPCSVCQHEIPLSAAISREASDYVEYYCGLECFEQWRKRSDTVSS